VEELTIVQGLKEDSAFFKYGQLSDYFWWMFTSRRGWYVSSKSSSECHFILEMFLSLHTKVSMFTCKLTATSTIIPEIPVLHPLV
jgi:hypothetical protein